MEWPSKNVPKGSIFNNAKVDYSRETKQFLKTLMEESNLTTIQRNKINYSLRNGEPLPDIPLPTAGKQKNQLFQVTNRPGSSKRRSLQTIQQSCAYDRDRFRSNQPVIDREKAKEALINKLAYGNAKPEAKDKPAKGKKNKEPEHEINRYEELKREIKDREAWLAEMDDLGEGPKYRGLIRLQILELLKEIESL